MERMDASDDLPTVSVATIHTDLRSTVKNSMK